MLKELDLFEAEALEAIASAQASAALEEVRIAYLARSGRLAAVTEKLKDVPKVDKPVVGKRLNEVKLRIQTLFDEKLSAFEAKKEAQSFDISLPGIPQAVGTLHPITTTTDRMVQIFRRMGFAVAEGPDIETEFHNFDALNTPAEHPSRNEQDTFYMDAPRDAKYGRTLLRTQTSTVQIRVMESQEPPLRVICPGRCYRRDEIDATHSSSFHQMEGLVVQEGVSLADLKGCLVFFFKELFGGATRVRLRPHFFPFTEPSYEYDVSMPGAKAGGKEWLELGGCGMVDPNVFKAVGYDAERYTGFAFGMGIDRIAMILHGVPDLRLFEQNDLRFLRQFTS